jgi:hypothetical protein
MTPTRLAEISGREGWALRPIMRGDNQGQITTDYAWRVAHVIAAASDTVG